jgi:hypothetical protein
MKFLLVISSIFISLSSSFAFETVQSKPVTFTPDNQVNCLDVVQALGYLANDQIILDAPASCQISGIGGKGSTFWSTLKRIGADVGTLGLNEGSCAADGVGVDCGSVNNTYNKTILIVRVRILGAPNTVITSSPYHHAADQFGTSADYCTSSASTINQLNFGADVSITATCDSDDNLTLKTFYQQ